MTTLTMKLDAQALPLQPPVYDQTVQDGRYTLVYKDGTYFTFQIETMTKGKLVGRRIVSYLSGPDNESAYTGFAFLNPDNRVQVWKRYANYGMVEKARHLTMLFTMPERLEEAGMDYATRSGRCRRCGRTLTVPTSIHRGYGPDCAQQIGVA